MTLTELRGVLRLQLGDEHIVRIVLEEITGVSYSVIAQRPTAEIDSNQLARAATIARALEAGVPLQHAIGHWSFRSLDLVTDDRALIPRPETELLVDIVLKELGRLRSVRGAPLHCLELGTGTGAIALSLVLECPDVEMTATDSSPSALDLARRNAEAVLEGARDRLRFLHGSWYAALPTIKGSTELRFDVICSNPPYLSLAEWLEVDASVRDYDPKDALVAGDDGLEAIRAIADGAAEPLPPPRPPAPELGGQQAKAPTEIAGHAGADGVEVLSDLAGRDRFILARF